MACRSDGQRCRIRANRIYGSKPQMWPPQQDSWRNSGSHHRWVVRRIVRWAFNPLPALQNAKTIYNVHSVHQKSVELSSRRSIEDFEDEWRRDRVAFGVFRFCPGTKAKGLCQRKVDLLQPALGAPRRFRADVCRLLFLRLLFLQGWIYFLWCFYLSWPERLFRTSLFRTSSFLPAPRPAITINDKHVPCCFFRTVSWKRTHQNVAQFNRRILATRS